MANFKIEPETAPGLCGTCRHAIVQTTTKNQTKVICGGGEPVFTVAEPLERCSMYRRKERPNPSETSWLSEMAWQPVIIVANGKRNKTFMDPDDDRLERADRNFGHGWDGVPRLKTRSTRIGVTK